jgi:hypothetical protein
LDVEASLALACVNAVVPNLPAAVLLSIMTYRIEVAGDDDPSDTYDVGVDQDALLDCCERNDQIASKKWEAKRVASKATKATRRRVAQSMVAKLRLGKKEAPAKGAINRLLKGEKVTSAVGRDRWLAKIRCDAAIIQDYRPPTGNIFVDERGGRVLVTYSGAKKRSISWTHRGMADASRLVLQQLWAWHVEATGEDFPDFPW